MYEAIILGVLSWMSLIISWWHLPQWFKNFTKRHPVISDLSAGLLIYFMLSSVSQSLIAVGGAVVAGLLTNFTIMLGKFYDRQQVKRQSN